MDSLRSVTLRGLRIGLVLAFIFAFISGPSLAVGPIDLILFDLFVAVTCVFLAARLWHTSTIAIPVYKSVLVPATAFLLLAILLPIAGVVVRGNPVGYFVGDLRWFQVGIIGLGFLFAHGADPWRFLSDSNVALKLILSFHLAFVLIQFLDYNQIVSTSPFLELWYAGGSQYGDYGYHIGRYAGAGRHSSGLGLSAVISIAIFGWYAVVHNREYGFLFTGFLLLIASGHRTSMVAAGGIGIVLLFYRLVIAVDIKWAVIRRTGYASVFGALAMAVLYYFNIGRIATSDRYTEILILIANPWRFGEISGRGERWEAAIAATRDYPVGTLSNPAHVLDHLPTIDSYFIITYLQGGVGYLVVYLLMLGSLFFASFRMSLKSDIGLVVFNFVLIISMSSLTQNFMTSTSGKFTLILALLLFTCSIKID